METVDSQSLQELLAGLIDKHRCPGASLALLHEGQLHTAVSGVMDVETGREVQLDSMFQIGSITKVMTATVIMQLVDQGKVDLDATVRTYLPDFRVADATASKTLTVRQLLTHTSGMDGDMMSDTGEGEERLARYIDRLALLPQAFPPGEGFSYSNSGYCLAGRIAEVVTGKSYDQVLKDMLFTPLGMSTAISAPGDFAGRDVASGHDPGDDGPIRLDTIFTLPVATAPAGSTPTMSATDLVRFAQMHLRGGTSDNGESVLSPESCAMMQETQVTVPVPARDISEWGLGWFVILPQGGRLFGHDGATVGQSAYLKIHAESGTIMVLLANVSGANALASDVFAETFDKLTGTSPKDRPKPVAADNEALEKYAGTYSSVGGSQVVTVEDGRLRVCGGFKLDDAELMQSDVRLEYGGNNQFLAEAGEDRYMVTHSFLGEDSRGVAKVMFTGLRVYNRCYSADDH